MWKFFRSPFVRLSINRMMCLCDVLPPCLHHNNFHEPCFVPSITTKAPAINGGLHLACHYCFLRGLWPGNFTAER